VGVSLGLAALKLVIHLLSSSNYGYFRDEFYYLAATLSDVSHSLAVEDQAKACIFTSNYGEAGALQFYSSRYDLPPVIGGHNNYYLWGPGNCTGEVILYLGHANVDDLKQGFADVQQGTVNKCRYCMPYENKLPIFLCRGIKMPIELTWPPDSLFQKQSVGRVGVLLRRIETKSSTQT
jgi:hypothetical protein